MGLKADENSFGWQVDWPVFVKSPFQAFGKRWERGEHFNWKDQKYRSDDMDDVYWTVFSLYKNNYIRHNREKEKTNKVGDRLGEMSDNQLYRLVIALNSIVKNKAASKTEFTKMKCKQSKITDKQRGLIRTFLHQNPWIVEDFYHHRDTILGE
jgi:hypothetical protein